MPAQETEAELRREFALVSAGINDILPHLLIRHTREFYERSCLRQPEAEARIAGRRLQLLDQIPAETHDTGTLEPFPLPRSPLWSRTSQDHIAKPPRGRGPKATAA